MRDGPFYAPCLKIAWRVIRPLYESPSKALDWISQRRKASKCLLEQGAVLYPCSRINNKGGRECIAFGRNSKILGKFETMEHGGKIAVGEDCFVGEGTYIWSATSVSIGNRVLISHGVNIHDTISHSLSASDRHNHFKAIFSGGHPQILENVPSLPIVISDDVWIGFGATILKGVTVGRGAVVGACSLVTKDVAPYTIVVGSPAREAGRSFE